MTEDIHHINRRSIVYALEKAANYKSGIYDNSPDIKGLVLADIRRACDIARQLGDKASLSVLSQALGETVEDVPTQSSTGPTYVTDGKPRRQTYAQDSKVSNHAPFED